MTGKGQNCTKKDGDVNFCQFYADVLCGWAHHTPSSLLLIIANAVLNIQLCGIMVATVKSWFCIPQYSEVQTERIFSNADWLTNMTSQLQCRQCPHQSKPLYCQKHKFYYMLFTLILIPTQIYTATATTACNEYTAKLLHKQLHKITHVSPVQLPL